MKKLFTIKLLLLLLPIALSAQNKPFSEDDIEVGIFEKLDNIVPLDLWFLNEQSDTVTLSEIINKPTILAFVYFDCPGICGPLLTGVSEVAEKLDMKMGEEFQIVTISFNPKDSPEKAITKKANYVQQIPEENRKHWIWLTGTQENIAQITKAVGYKYKPQGLDFAHPGAIIILSPAGKVTRYLYGLTYLPFDVKMALIEAQKGKSSPTINKILEYCFSYDPTSRTYTLQITRVVGSFIIVIAIFVFVYLLLKGRRKKTEK